VLAHFGQDFETVMITAGFLHFCVCSVTLEIVWAGLKGSCQRLALVILYLALDDPHERLILVAAKPGTQLSVFFFGQLLKVALDHKWSVIGALDSGGVNPSL